MDMQPLLLPTNQIKLLEKAEECTRAGRHAEAIRILDQLTKEIQNYFGPEAHLFYLDAKNKSLIARNKLHLHLDQEVAALIDAIPDIIRRANPGIDAECNSIRGILLRRDAHETWKRGDSVGALEKAEQAKNLFRLTFASATMATDDRLKINARLNELYTDGLILAIQQANPAAYEHLVISAVIFESDSRYKMADDNKDYLTGLMIVTDLALGASLGLNQMFDLSNSNEYRKAYHRIFGQERSWPELILNQCRRAETLSPNIIAKALQLGSKILLSEGNGNDELYGSYCYLMHFNLELMVRNEMCQAARTQISRMISKFPEHVQERWMRARVFR